MTSVHWHGRHPFSFAINPGRVSSTGAQLDPRELERPLSHITLPSVATASAESPTPAG